MEKAKKRRDKLRRAGKAHTKAYADAEVRYYRWKSALKLEEDTLKSYKKGIKDGLKELRRRRISLRR